MKQRWSKKQVQEKVDMYTRNSKNWTDEQSIKAKIFFTDKLNVMDFKKTKSITIDTEILYNL